MRIRQYIESNYKSVFFNGKTIRMKIDNSSPILSIPTPEIEDVAINNRCLANCFIPGTKIRTSSGFKNIEDITTEDVVVSYNEQNNVFENKNVYELFENEYCGEIITLELENKSKISCTPNHKFLTQRGWIEAGFLLETDELLDFK